MILFITVLVIAAVVAYFIIGSKKKQSFEAPKTIELVEVEEIQPVAKVAKPKAKKKSEKAEPKKAASPKKKITKKDK